MKSSYASTQRGIIKMQTAFQDNLQIIWMKKARYAFTILSLLISNVTFAQEGISSDSSYTNSHYVQRLEFFRRIPDQKNEIVFVGNSITEQGEWQELIAGKNVINRGISGDVTFGIPARLDEILHRKPSKIFLLMGINDMKRGIPNETIIKNYNILVIATQRKSPSTKIFIQSVLPVNKVMLTNPYSKLNNEKIHNLNAQLQQICKRYKITYVNLHEDLADANGELKKKLSIDGLHLRSTAYIIWVNYLRKVHLL